MLFVVHPLTTCDIKRYMGNVIIPIIVGKQNIATKGKSMFKEKRALKRTNKRNGREEVKKKNRR